MRANLIAALIGMLCVAGCGGGGGSSLGSNSNSSGGGTTPTGSNVQSVIVDSGPTVVASSNTPAVNTLYTSITICAPGSTTNCQTIDHIQVDTGSSGVRILASALTVTLPQEASGGNPVAECTQFVDGSAWGTVRNADVKVAGETASNQVIQVIGDGTYPVPTACTATIPSGGQLEDGVTQFGANGILGVGPFIQDCGPGCAQAATNIYYTCTSTAANGCAEAAVPQTMQVANPVASFTTDNNGVIIQLPAASGTAASLTGYLIFGIGTQGNNGLGSAQVFTLATTGTLAGSLTTDYKGNTLSASYIDSGSNAYYFPNDGTIYVCGANGETTSANGFYCPQNGTVNLTATIVGVSGTTSPTINFSVANANNLFSSSNSIVAVAPSLAAPSNSSSSTGGPSFNSTQTFDWGLPFHYGRSVYTAIETMNTSGGMGPYFAF